MLQYKVLQSSTSQLFVTLLISLLLFVSPRELHGKISLPRTFSCPSNTESTWSIKIQSPKSGLNQVRRLVDPASLFCRASPHYLPAGGGPPSLVVLKPLLSNLLFLLSPPAIIHVQSIIAMRTLRSGRAKGNLATLGADAHDYHYSRATSWG